MTLSYAAIEKVWTDAGGNPQAASVAAAVAMAESGGNPAAIGNNSNGTLDRGLWQINSVHGAQSTTDLMGNARAAIAISSNGSNWRPWCTAWTNGCAGTYDPTAPNTPSGKAFAAGGVGGSVPSGGTAAAPAGLTTNPLNADFWTHIIDVVGNWVFYTGLIVVGGVVGFVGFAILFRDTPAGAASVSAVRKAATVVPFL